MRDDMGTFRIDFEIANPALPETRRVVRSALVDTGAELSWIPSEMLESLGIERYSRSRVRQANGRILERWTEAGPASIQRIGGSSTRDPRRPHFAESRRRIALR